MSNINATGEQYCCKCGKAISGDQIFIYDANYCQVTFYCKECYSKELNLSTDRTNMQFNYPTDRELLWKILSKLDEILEEIKAK